MFIRDEITFNEEKARILRELVKSRNNLQLFQDCLVKFGREWYETIELEKNHFKQLSEELIELKKQWRKACQMISK